MARKSKKVIEEAANRAAEEAVEELETETFFDSPEERDLSLSNEFESGLSDAQAHDRDAFAEAEDIALRRSTFYKSRFYVNGEWIGTIDGSYSWERFRADYPDAAGVVKVTIVDGNNKFVTSQTLRIARKPGQNQAPVHQTAAPSRDLEMIEVMRENQREAEAKAASQQAGLASIMQAITMQQQESNKLMMQMFMESTKQNQQMMMTLFSAQNQKAPDPIVGLLTTLLTQSPKDTGPKALELIQMLEKAKKDAKDEARENFRMIEEKSRKLADELIEAQASSGGEEEESLTKTLLKGFMPVLASMAQGQQAQNQRALPPGNGGLNEGFIDNTQQALRPAIAGPNPRAQRPQRPAQAAAGHVTTSRPVAPVQAPVVTQNATGPVAVQETPANSAAPVKDFTLNAEGKKAIFNFCSADIGQALIANPPRPASKVAEELLAKLEKEGISRQTVANGFKLDDFYEFAKPYIPGEMWDQAARWLKEFHEAIQATTSPQPVRTTAVVGDGPNGTRPNGAAKPVATVRNGSSAARTRTQSREPAKNI